MCMDFDGAVLLAKDEGHGVGAGLGERRYVGFRGMKVLSAEGSEFSGRKDSRE